MTGNLQTEPRHRIWSRLDQLAQRHATQGTTILFVVVAVTGTLLFFHIGKATLTGMHEWLGMLFVIIGSAHAARHRHLLFPMANQRRFQVIAATTAVVVLAFLILTPTGRGNPFRKTTLIVMDAPLAAVAPVLGVPVEDLVRRLNAQGITADEAQSINAIARRNKVAAMGVLTAVTNGERR